MKTLYAPALFLFLLSTPAFAEGSSAQQLCEQARIQHKNKDAAGADLSIAMAKSNADHGGVVLPDWCKKHYQEIRMSGLAYSLQKFEAGYGDDWNSAWNEISWIEHTAREFNVTLSPVYYAKAVVVKAKNEEIRQYIISLCEPQDKCLLRD